MMVTPKRLVLVGLSAAALGGAGLAGAVVEGKVTTIKRGQWAQAGTSPTYCLAYVDPTAQAPAFDCGYWNGNVHLPNSYSASIGEYGVDVYRLDSNGRKYKKIRSWRNP